VPKFGPQPSRRMAAERGAAMAAVCSEAGRSLLASALPVTRRCMEGTTRERMRQGTRFGGQRAGISLKRAGCDDCFRGGERRRHSVTPVDELPEAWRHELSCTTGVVWDLLTEEEGHWVGLLSSAAENRGGVGAALTRGGQEAVDGDTTDNRHARGRGVHQRGEGRAPAGFESFCYGPAEDGCVRRCFVQQSDGERQSARGAMRNSDAATTLDGGADQGRRLLREDDVKPEIGGLL
jgi:hypothetical protein